MVLLDLGWMTLTHDEQKHFDYQLDIPARYWVIPQQRQIAVPIPLSAIWGNLDGCKVYVQDVITSKRHRTWQKVLEQIIIRYIDLCVMLKKGREAKDGLIHYRNVCQQVNVSSLEEVIKYFLKSATDKAEEAQSKADLVSA